MSSRPEPRLTPELLLHGYAQGVFPMAEGRDDPEIFWVDPRQRGVLPLDGFRISRSLARRMRRGGFEIVIDGDFEGVVAGCADRAETWINDEIFSLYAGLHRLGFAHSVEIRHEGELTGGIYGVTLGAAFFGESMFSRRTDASKLAMVWLVDRLRLGGFTLFDAQFLTPHLASLGFVETPRARYRAALAGALEGRGDFLAPGPPAPAQEVLQRNGQTS
ncbi:leucyl/phenylalanyl-tRNA--protein transferase [Limimaricola cinnabarinus]|uniref:Leucyl/phenylalanyl-tRNA--protein transferase n=1 Tax=Limimaricola cinnabarinus TaxID=1125964 RepID=A0A2G1MKK1_9RHOB|nr:leucyl/phenylalanyl-tRNA--protein transferase [Limimaricola cinnabarinus]PHP29278.1 leucyl/phenylalanyl-tRNA--protein transferase [Limimaricola cinnabarinus]